jgi:hypothetical protein
MGDNMRMNVFYSNTGRSLSADHGPQRIIWEISVPICKHGGAETELPILTWSPAPLSPHMKEETCPKWPLNDCRSQWPLNFALFSLMRILHLWSIIFPFLFMIVRIYRF